MRDPEEDGPEQEWRLPDQEADAAGPGSGARRVKPAHAVLGSLLALVLLCCGGAAVVRGFAGGSDDATGAATWQQPSTAPLVTTQPAPPVPTVPVTTVSAKPSKSKKPKKPKKPTTAPTTRKPATKPPTSPTVSPAPTAPGPIVRAGAFCSPVGAFGVTATGKLMRCTRRAGEERARWRAV
jgi:cell division septation protein DedD